MRKRVTTGIVAAITAAALSVPAAGLAATGGAPNAHAMTNACTAHTHGKSKHKGTLRTTKGKTKTASRGKKCGLK